MPYLCLSAVKTGFGRNGRQTKSSPERGGIGASWGLLLLFHCHIGTRKCSKFVVKCEKIVVLRGFRGGISGLIQVVPWQTNSILCIKRPRFCLEYDSMQYVQLQFAGDGRWVSRNQRVG